MSLEKTVQEESPSDFRRRQYNPLELLPELGIAISLARRRQGKNNVYHNEYNPTCREILAGTALMNHTLVALPLLFAAVALAEHYCISPFY